MLEQYDLCDLSRLSFISDRGANLVKALREYDTLFCFLHRVNNILKRAFFQSKNKQNRLTKSKTAQSSASSSTITDKDYCPSDSSTEDEELFTPTVQIKQKRSKKKQQSKTPDDQVKLQFEDLPSEAQEIIKNIEKCKDLVRYIKKVSDSLRYEGYFVDSLFYWKVINVYLILEWFK